MYPINLRLKGRRCAVIGGGKVACRKVRALLAAGALVTVFSPELHSGLLECTARNPACCRWQKTAYVPGLLEGFFLVFCAADDRSVNQQAAREARQLGVLVNAASEPELCDFTVPARVERGDLLITVSTGGKSPALARLLRERLEQEFSEADGIWLEHLAVLREQLKRELQDTHERQAFWRFALQKNILDLVREGHIDQAEAELKHAIDCFRAES